MSRRSLFVVSVMVVAVGVGAVAVRTGGARLRQWLLELHGIHAGHGSARQRRASEATPATWPQSNAGQLARHWVEAFSSGEDAMRQFLRQELAPASLAQRGVDERAAEYRVLHERLGTLTLGTVGSTSTSELQATLIASDGSAHDFKFEVQVDAPFKLVSVTLLDALPRPH